MKFFSLKDKLDEFSYSYGAADKFKCGAKILGVVAANTVIAAGKVAQEVLVKQREMIDSKKK